MNRTAETDRSHEKHYLTLTVYQAEGIFILTEGHKATYLLLSEGSFKDPHSAVQWPNPSKARVAFDAPEEVRIYRERLIRNGHPELLNRLHNREIVTLEMLRELEGSRR